MSKSLYKGMYHDFDSVSIIGDKNDSGKNARLTLSFRDGSPRLVVYTGDTGTGSVLFHAFSPMSFDAFCERFKDMTKEPNGTKETIKLSSEIWENNAPTGRFQIRSSLHYGKSKDGLMYLSVIEEGKQKIVFLINRRPSEAYFDTEGNPLPESEVSQRMCRSFVRLASKVSEIVMVKRSEERVISGERVLNEVQSFNGGGGNNRNNGNDKPKPQQSSQQRTIADELSDLDL